MKSWKSIKAELSVGKLVGVLIFVVIAMALLPTIISSTNAGVNSSDDYGSAQTLLTLVPLFYVIAILVAVIVWVVHETGGMGG
jgi:hypothetical protein